MNNKIDCRIIQDLLPSYIDGLTSEYTNQAIEEHVEQCEPCKEMLQRMREPENRSEHTEQEVDIMKKIRNKMSYLIYIILVSIFIFALGVLTCALVYNRVVPKNYQEVFSVDDAKYFIATDVFSRCEMILVDFEAEDYQNMLESGRYYYEGKEGNVIEGKMFTIIVGDFTSPLYEMKITDQYKLYYEGKVYDIRECKHLWDYLENRIQSEPEWSVYEKNEYRYLKGKYVMKSDEATNDIISFELNLDDKTFMLSTSGYSSVHERGTFTIDDFTVTLNGEYKYVFRIVDYDVLSYQSSDSDPLCIMGSDTSIPDDTKFYKE